MSSRMASAAPHSRAALCARPCAPAPPAIISRQSGMCCLSSAFWSRLQALLAKRLYAFMITFGQRGKG